VKKALTKQEMEALGRRFDERMGETDAEWEEAARSGEIYAAGELGCASLAEASGKLSEMRAAGKKPERKMYSFRLPIVLVEGLKRKAKAERKPYQRVVNEALWAAV
jgi:hypothetical protein